MDKQEITHTELLENIMGLLLSVNLMVQILHRNGALDKHEVIKALAFMVEQINEIKPTNNLTPIMTKLVEYISVEFPNLFSPPSSTGDETRRALLRVIEGGLQSKNKCRKE